MGGANTLFNLIIILFTVNFFNNNNYCVMLFVIKCFLVAFFCLISFVSRIIFAVTVGVEETGHKVQE